MIQAAATRKRIVVACDGPGLAEEYCRFLNSGRCDGNASQVCESATGQSFPETDCSDNASEAPASCVGFSPENSAVLSHSPVSPEHLGNLLKEKAASELVVFASSRVTPQSLQFFSQISKLHLSGSLRCLVILSGLNSHFDADDHDDASVVLEKLSQNLPSAVLLTVIRTGFVISPAFGAGRVFERLSPFRSLVSTRLTSTFLNAERLFQIIEHELLHPREDLQSAEATAAFRQITVLGPRAAWRSQIRTTEKPGIGFHLLHWLSTAFSLAGLSWLLFWAICAAGRLIPRLRQWHFHTLKPRTVKELISLYNRHNCQDVVIAGYNNGVNHFGWSFPSKTVVLTTGTGTVFQLSDASLQDPEQQLRKLTREGSQPGEHRGEAFLTVDAGLTLNHCVRELRKRNLEFLVVPNYTWISMGTLFFVPVHGSGSKVSTLSDTIEDVLLYDGQKEQFLLARRSDQVFRDSMYNTQRSLLLLRMTLRVKRASQYLVKRSISESVSAKTIMDFFADPEASNVEIRKNKAASAAIEISRYYPVPDAITTDFSGVHPQTQSSTAAAKKIDVPQDKIGRIWDRLEETPVVSTLFHWFVRTFAFHVELFLKPDEFEIFWTHHQSLPVSKIQLRRILRDGMTHSACRTDDCISADLFMTRRHRDVFNLFIQSHLPHVRCNPGKQSL